MAALDFLQDKLEETHNEEHASSKQMTHRGPQIQDSATVPGKMGDKIYRTYTLDSVFWSIQYFNVVFFSDWSSWTTTMLTSRRQCSIYVSDHT